MNRPAYVQLKQRIDYLLEYGSILLLALLISIPIYYYSILPDIIPRHFNAAGEADGFSARDIIWVLPLIGLILYTGLTFAQRVPQHFNYVVLITDDNAQVQYRLAVRLIQLLKTILLLAFTFILVSSIQIALGNWLGLGVFFLPTFMATIITTIIIYLVMSFRNK